MRRSKILAIKSEQLFTVWLILWPAKSKALYLFCTKCSGQLSHISRTEVVPFLYVSAFLHFSASIFAPQPIFSTCFRLFFFLRCMWYMNSSLYYSSVAGLEIQQSYILWEVFFTSLQHMLKNCQIIFKDERREWSNSRSFL